MKHWRWRAYFGIFTVITAGAVLGTIVVSSSSFGLFELARVCIWAIGLFGLYAYCYGKRVGSKSFWLAILLAEVLFLAHSLTIGFEHTVGEPRPSVGLFAANLVYFGVVFGPYFYALYDYAASFRVQSAT